MTTLTDLGKRIRTERLMRELTLEQLSKKTGLSKSFISQIERGLTQPSITSLKVIATQFGLSVVALFSSEDNTHPGWEYHGSAHKNDEKRPLSYIDNVHIVRVDKRKKFALPGSNVLYDLLTPDMNRQLEVMLMRVSPGENSGAEPMLDPPGEKVGFVLKGSIELSVGKESHQLEEGDSVYYPAHIPHSWRALEGDPVEVIWILTPPSF